LSLDVKLSFKKFFESKLVGSFIFIVLALKISTICNYNTLTFSGHWVTASSTSQACYNSSLPWNVGTGTMELNGTYDMMGNVWQWNENETVLYGSNCGFRLTFIYRYQKWSAS
jgi:hypothetical protein